MLRKYLLVILLSSVALFTIFPRLESLPLREWDESRQAASAYEMYDTGNYLVATFDYKADLWNTKPPFLLWLQVLSMKIFGVGVLAIRLPSAIAMLLSAFALFYFFTKLKKPLSGFFSALVFVCSKGLIYYHCGRSGDYDSLMILFIILYCGFFYLFTRLHKNKYLILFFVFLTLACFSKGIQGVIPLGGIFIFALFTNNFIPFLKNKNTYIGIAIFILFIGGFYLIRESLEPGYLKAVWHNELGGRFLSVLEEHSGGKWYYLDFLKNNQFAYFFWFIPISFVLNFVFKDKEIRNANLYLASLAIFYFVVISVAKTKLEWYSLPLIPAFASIIGIAMGKIYFLISENSFFVLKKWIQDSKNSFFVLKTLIFILMLSIFYIPSSEIIKHNLEAKEVEEYQPFYSRVNLMKNIVEHKSNKEYKEISYIIEERTQLDFFYYYYMRANGIEVNVKPVNDLKVGEYVQVNNLDNLDKIQQYYETEETDFLIQSRILFLKSEKQNSDGNISNNTKL